MNRRFAIYIKDDEICKLLNERRNRSEYIERAVRFYIENKDIIPQLLTAIKESKA